MIPAIIEVKGLQVTEGNYKLNGRAVDQQAAKIHGKYIDKAKWCDKHFANEIVHGNPTAQGPFELALQAFHKGSPLGVVIGGNSEVNRTLDDIITLLAKSYASTPEGLMVSPELSSRGPNGAYGILKAQF